MNRKIVTVLLVVLLLIGGGLVLVSTSTKDTDTQTNINQKLIPADAITHGHGLSVDVADPNKLYIATHHGLLVLVNEKDLYRVGESEDDYMGFSPHPSDPKVFFTSGHPSTGGNVGFQRSVDGGFTWEKVSDGVNGPVDFHAMSVSMVNPELIYGWYNGALQKTTDGGNTWEIVGVTKFPVVHLAADPKDENVVYAASPQGLFISKNKGSSWEQMLDGFVSSTAINPENSQNLIIFSEKQQLAQSMDGGKNWETLTIDLNGETPLYISFSRQQPKSIYLLTEKNSIYKSSDGGDSWNKIR